MTKKTATKTTPKFWTARAKKIAAARARNEKKGTSVRAQRLVAFVNRTFEKTFRSEAAARRFVQQEINTVHGETQRVCGLVFNATA